MNSSISHVVIRFFFLSLVLQSSIAKADSPPMPWQAPAFSLTSEELLAAAEALPKEEGAEVQILLREMLVRFEEDGRRVETYRIVYRILTAAGVEGWGGTGGVWKPWHQERPILRSRVIAPDGSETWLDPATIGERPLGDATENVLSDRLVVEAPLPTLTVGAVVEESVETRDTQPTFARGVVDTFSFGQSNLAVQHTRLVLNAPQALPLRYVAQLLGDLEPERTEEEGRVVLTFEAGPQEGIESIEELAPGTVPVWPQVRYSTGDSWAAVANHYHDLVEGQLAGTTPEELVERAMQGASGLDTTSRVEKAAQLLAWLHREVRYTGVEFAEAAIVPRSPEETLARGYGDCKDKATLLVALLRGVGIPASLALLNTGPGPDVAPELPGLGFFDHAIVYVPEDPDLGPEQGRELWIDPTDEFARVGELPTGDQNRLALVAAPSTQGFLTTPAAGPEENRFIETREVFLNPDLGGARLVETSRYWGAFERSQRSALSQSNTEELEEHFADYMESAYSAEEFIGLEHSEFNDLSMPFELRLEAKEASVAFTDLNQAVVYLAPDMLLNSLPDLILEDEDESSTGEPGDITGTTREADLVLPVPYSGEYRYRIIPPDGYRPVSLLGAESRNLGPATLSREVREEEDGTVLLTLSFDTGKGRLTPEEIEALREGAQEVFAEEVLQVEFEQVAEAHLAAGKVAEALAEIDRLVAASPGKALPRTRRARALLEGGLGAAARREAEAALALEPEFYIAHQALGLIYIRDLVGREFHQGMDNQRAAEAFRRAVELEPKDAADRQNLAVLLEHNEEGVQFGPGAPLDEAIREFTTMCDDLEEPQCYEVNLLTLLARTGRYDEMLRRVSKPGRTTDSFTLMALAATKGSAEALRASRKIRNKAQLQEVLATAGQLLLQHRLYPQAADLVAGAAKGADEPTKVLAVVGILRKAQRFEELNLSDDDPADIVRKLMIALASADLDAAQALLSEGAQQLQEEEGMIAASAKPLEILRRSLAQAGLSLEGVIELGFAAMTTSVDGDEDLGYRVRLRANFAGTISKETYFVVRENGALRLAADENLVRLGHQILHFYEEGNFAAARQWLDWAHEATSAPPADDPFAGHPFFHFWSPGKEGEPAEIHAAAASLLANTSMAKNVIAILGREREKIAPEERRRFDLALADAHEHLDHHQTMVEMARGWLADHPKSVAAFHLLRNGLLGQENWDDLEEAAKERLSALEDDSAALRALIMVASGRRNDEEKRRLYKHLIELGKAKASDYNNLAWMDVAEGKVTEGTLETAQQVLSDGTSRNYLHTLATVYAELGMSTEAREVILQAMALENEPEPKSGDWYVWGLIAESYGVLDSAAEAYRKVEAPEDSSQRPGSPYQLAQRRLKSLEAKLAAFQTRGGAKRLVK